MNRNNDGCGCLAQLIVFGLIGLIAFCVDFYNGTQYGMMSDARDHSESRYYLDYLEKYPKGRYSTEAKDSIVSISLRESDIRWLYRNIDRLEGDAVCEKIARIAYNRVLSSNTIEEWKEYVESVPSQYHWDATDRIDSIENESAQAEAKAWGTEQRAWNTVSQTHSYYNLKKYLELYPNGRHSRNIKKEIIDYEVARDFAGEHGTMPSMNQTRSGNGRFSTITVINQTSYEMTLLYSGGTDSERLVISGGGTWSVRLPNGSYRISARVNSSNVISYVGSETLIGGEYTVSYYISSSRY